MVGTAPRTRKRVGANLVPLKRGENGSGFTNCKKCKKAVPVGAVDVHDCKLDAKIKFALECHHPIKSSDKYLSQWRSKKRKNKEEAEDAKTSRMTKKPRGPQEPKKPHAAFLVFMTDFRKKNEGNADLNEVNKLGIEKWKSMTEEEKQPHIDRADELRMEYEHALAEYHEELRQFNEEGDSAEVGIIDMAYYESPYEDSHLYESEDGPESDED